MSENRGGREIFFDSHCTCSKFQTKSNKVLLMKDCLWRLLVHVHEDVACLNVTHNKTAYDEGSGWISSYTN